VDVRRLQATKQHPAPAAAYPEVLYGHVPPPPGFVFPPGLPLHKSQPASSGAPATTAPASTAPAVATTSRGQRRGTTSLPLAVGALACVALLAAGAALAGRRRRRDLGAASPTGHDLPVSPRPRSEGS